MRATRFPRGTPFLRSVAVRARRLAARGAALVTLALLALVAACGGSGGVTGLDDRPGQFAGGARSSEPTTAPTADPALVGTWSRILVLFDQAGSVSTSETQWTFFADGSFIRRVIARNFGLGLADEIVTRGSWSTDGNSFLIAHYSPASGGSVRFAYRIQPGLDGTTLFLDALAFRRIAA